MASTTGTAERSPAEKAILFCPECSHESRINGDWIIHVLEDSIAYECPNCGATIESRAGRETFTGEPGGSLRFADS